MRIAAAAVAVAYIAVQVFQDIVYRVLPTPATPTEELLAGAHPLHLVRSTLMLFAMVGLIFIYTTLALQRIRARPVLAGFAIACFGVFGLLEIGLRSVELFWTQVQLPHEPAGVDQLVAFQAVQGALYFPLMLATWIGSVLLFVLFRDRLLRAILALNLARITARLLTSYAHVPLLPTDVYEQIYLGLVIAFYGPLAYWLCKGRVSDGPAGIANPAGHRSMG